MLCKALPPDFVKKADAKDCIFHATHRACQNALIPVSSRPIVSWWIVSVPS